MRCLPGRRRQLNNSQARSELGLVHDQIRPQGDCASYGTRLCRRRGVGTTLGLLLQMPANRTTISCLNFSATSKRRITASVHGDL